MSEKKMNFTVPVDTGSEYCMCKCEVPDYIAQLSAGSSLVLEELPGYRLVLEELPKPKPEADSFDFTETLIYYMLPSFFIFLAIALIFYLFHPYTTDDKCFEFQQRLLGNVGKPSSSRKSESNRTSI